MTLKLKPDKLVISRAVSHQRKLLQMRKSKKIIAPRLLKVKEVSVMFLDVIVNSLDMVPYGIRWISKQIRKLTKQKFPDATPFHVGSLVGSFFMLRFMNPAIVTPQAYMLVDQQLSVHARRTTTLVAKMLQNLTNKPNYAKEQYMLPLNGFIEENKERMTKFFNDLCEVGDFHEQLEIDQYLALTKREISLTITLNEVYNTHELVLKHIEDLAPASDDHLRIVSLELGPAPKQLPRNENKPVQLNLFSRWETPIPDLTNMLKLQETPNEVLYENTKHLIVQILRSLPAKGNMNSVKGKLNNDATSSVKSVKKSESSLSAASSSNLSLSAIIDAAVASKNDSALVRKGLQAAENLRKLETEGLVSSKNNYAQLTAQVGEELLNLEALREKVLHEIESLEGVYQIIKDHNDYLKSQLETYRAYLQNVRMQSGGLTSNITHTSGPQLLGPYKFSHAQLEKDGVIIESEVPENRRSNIYFNFTSPIPGTFIIALHYKGRDKAILELDLKLDDLLEKQMSNDQTLDLEYVQLNVNKMLHLLNKTFLKK